jgi:hypothetical protein
VRVFGQDSILDHGRLRDEATRLPTLLVITSKPAIGYHLKTGQRNHTQDQMMLWVDGKETNIHSPVMDRAED